MFDMEMGISMDVCKFDVCLVRPSPGSFSIRQLQHCLQQCHLSSKDYGTWNLCTVPRVGLPSFPIKPIFMYSTQSAWAHVVRGRSTGPAMRVLTCILNFSSSSFLVK